MYRLAARLWEIPAQRLDATIYAFFSSVSILDECASIFGLSLRTAAYGLFHPDYLGLVAPTYPRTHKGCRQVRQATYIYHHLRCFERWEKCCTAWHIRRLSGSVYFVAEGVNYAKGLGAAFVINYKSKTLAKNLFGVLKGHELVGTWTITRGTVEVYAAVLKQDDPMLTRSASS